MLLKLLALPITAPVSGFEFILNTLKDAAERELYDEGRLRDELLLLNLRLDEGELTEQQFKEREQEIIARMRAARERRQQTGG